MIWRRFDSMDKVLGGEVVFHGPCLLTDADDVTSQALSSLDHGPLFWQVPTIFCRIGNDIVCDDICLASGCNEILDLGCIASEIDTEVLRSKTKPMMQELEILIL